MKAISQKKFQTAEYVSTIWCATPEHGTPFEDLLKPEYWAHVANQMRPSNRIEVIAEDGSYFAELLVTDCSRLWAKVYPLRLIDLTVQQTEYAAPASAEYIVKWRGPNARFGVIRAGDNELVQEGFATKADAATYITDLNNKLAAA